ncbi:MAG: hypothetical protein LBH53_03735 [Puniceicoccales bacterium]|jgi:hypothetical protein|nr:hypothetical protein [Puniceicoccales bacterium]
MSQRFFKKVYLRLDEFPLSTAIVEGCPGALKNSASDPFAKKTPKV